jgi:UDP-2,3-diacylglucosamine pyrophosphatase LpxH
MVVGFTTTCAISPYHHQSCQFNPRSLQGVLNTPYLLKTNSKNYVLIHGDELCTDDRQYQNMQLVRLANSSPNKKSRLPPVIKTLVVLLSVLSAEITLG